MTRVQPLGSQRASGGSSGDFSLVQGFFSKSSGVLVLTGGFPGSCTLDCRSLRNGIRLVTGRNRRRKKKRPNPSGFVSVKLVLAGAVDPSASLDVTTLASSGFC